MIEAGQLYRSADWRDEGRTIQIITVPVNSTGKVFVGTVSRTGKLIRQRWIDTASLHESPLTRDGVVRRTGYIKEN